MEGQNAEPQSHDLTVPSAGLKPVVYNSDGIVGKEAYEAWRQATSPLFDVTPTGLLPAFKSAYTFYELDGVVFNRTCFSETAYHRTSRHVRRGDRDFFAVNLFLNGRERGQAAGSPMLIAPDRIVLRDWSQPFTTTADETDQIGILIPRERIDSRDDFGESRPTVSWDFHSPQGMMLGNAIRSVWHALPYASAEDAPALANGFLGLLNGLLSSSRGPAEEVVINRANLAAMKAYLVRRLGDPALGPQDLVRAFHCSRAVIYRMFGESGGVRAFIQERRLAECFRELTASREAKRPAWQVAARWGFRDPAYFCRAFKRRFGITAGEAASMRRERPVGASVSGGTVENITTLHSWLGSRDGRVEASNG